ncbi:MAG: Lrp/AsnC family transcriptional regulator [Reyranella sp.]|nr:Lrp/AsnC family transcriptional regulator [Reyranella sp.]
MALDEGVDELNLGIIGALQLDPRITNKDLADRFGVTEATIASRIRNMEDQDILRVMMQRDMRALGWQLIALIDVRVERRRPEDVAAELVDVEEAVSVSITMSNPEIVMVVGARDGLHLLEIIERKISPVAGIASYEIMTALEVLKFDARYGALEAER